MSPEPTGTGRDWRVGPRADWLKGQRKSPETQCFRGSLLARWTGLEPAASGVTGRRYNQLNYHRIHLRAEPFGTGLVAWGGEGVKGMIRKPNSRPTARTIAYTAATATATATATAAAAAAGDTGTAAGTAAGTRTATVTRSRPRSPPRPQTQPSC